MYVSFEYKFLYMPPPKTGSTGLINLLSNKYQVYEVGTKHDIFLPTVFESFFTFATVRNPYTLMVSRFNHARRDSSHPAHIEVTKMDFNRFVQWCTGNLYLEELKNVKYLLLSEWLKQNPNYTPPRGCSPVRLDAIIKLESLEADFNNKLPFVRERVTISPNNIGKNHPIYRSGELHWNEGVYTQDTLKMIMEWAKPDFDLFGYSYDPPSNVLLE